MQAQTNAWTVIQEIEQDNSRLYKEAIVRREALNGNTEFFAGCLMAFDALVTFGVKQVPEKTNADGPGLSWDQFSTAAESLIARNVTGHAARDLIISLMNTATAEQWNGWYRRVLIKDMRAGFSESTVNKVVIQAGQDHYKIPVFTCQLAHDSAKHEGKVKGKKLIDIKLDGVRVITIVYPNGRVDQYSRNGKELVNFAHVKTQLAKVAHTFSEPMVLDGEIMSGSFQALMKQIHRKSSAKASDAVLNLFDMLPLKDFQAEICYQPQTERSALLAEWFSANESALDDVTVIEQELVDLDTPEGYARYLEINRCAIEIDPATQKPRYEGIMLKNPDGLYQLKRSADWLKVKPFIEVSLAITAIEEGTGRNLGKLGAFVCQGEDDGKMIQVNVGSGFSDVQREEYYDHDLVGDIVEVRADAITQNQDGTYSLRFPRFLHFRGFEHGEKL